MTNQKDQPAESLGTCRYNQTGHLGLHAKSLHCDEWTEQATTTRTDSAERQTEILGRFVGSSAEVLILLERAGIRSQEEFKAWWKAHGTDSVGAGEPRHTEGDSEPTVCPGCQSVKRKMIYKGWGDETYLRNYFPCRHPWHSENKPAFIEFPKVGAQPETEERAARELFIVERSDGEWVDSTGDGGFSVWRTRAEAQDALETEADNAQEAENYAVVRFARKEE